MPDRHIPPSSDTRRVRTIARWFTLAILVLILYGSLFPFRFSALGDIEIAELIRHARFARASRGDIVANLLLYMPLGLCLMLAWPAAWRRPKAMFWTIGLGSLLSLAVELLQIYATSRVSSLTDFALNLAGTAAGALLAILYAALGSTIRVPGAAAGRPDPVPLGLLALWLAYRLAPFVPTIDWQKYKDAFKPLLIDPDLSVPNVFRFAVGWLIAGYAVRRVWRREYSLHALAVIVCVVLLGRIAIVGKTLSLDEIAALLICIPCGAVLTMLSDRRRALVLVMLLAAVITLEGLRPFLLLAQPHAFSWVPFINSLSDNIEVNYSVLLEKCFWYFALTWLLVRRGFPVGSATLVTVILLAAIEAVQAWIPDRSAEITDPLLAACGGILLALALRKDTGPRVAVPGF